MYAYQQYSQHDGDGSDISDDDDDKNDKIGLLIVGYEGDNDCSNKSVEGREEEDDDKNETLVDVPNPSADDLRKLTVAELKVKLSARGLLQHGRKEELIERFINPKDSDFKSKTNIEK